jgi:DivIVA domain-containing protein
VSYSFPFASPDDWGYQTQQVDAFIEKARVQYSNPNSELVTSNSLRNTEFDLIKGGFEIAAVDTAMDRLEDTFAKREIERQMNLKGQSAVLDRLDRIIEIVQGRLVRPKRRKFSNVGWLLRGYSRSQVDQLCAQIQTHLDSGEKLQLNVVRRAIFKAKRGGYVEAQVDAFLDRVAEILQIEKNS